MEVILEKTERWLQASDGGDFREDRMMVISKLGDGRDFREDRMIVIGK